MRIDNTASLGKLVSVLWTKKQKLIIEMTQWKYNTIDRPNTECARQPLNNWSQPKRSPDYSVSQDKEMIIKPL